MTHSGILAHIASITHTSPEEFKLLAVARNYVTHSEIMNWLKSEFELEHGHATMISHLILPDVTETNRRSKLIAELFSGTKADWLPAYDELVSKLNHFGSDIKIVPTKENILLQRSEAVFGLIKITNQRLTIGVNLPGEAYTPRFASAFNWTDAVSHCIDVSVYQQINDELISWLKAAYARAL